MCLPLPSHDFIIAGEASPWNIVWIYQREIHSGDSEPFRETIVLHGSTWSSFPFLFFPSRPSWPSQPTWPSFIFVSCPSCFLIILSFWLFCCLDRLFVWFVSWGVKLESGFSLKWALGLRGKGQVLTAYLPILKLNRVLNRYKSYKYEEVIFAAYRKAMNILEINNLVIFF